jgi:BolA protein
VSAETLALLRERLAALQPESLAIEDESHLHAGHAVTAVRAFPVDIVAAALFRQKDTRSSSSGVRCRR